MPREVLRGRLESPPLMPITERQVDILKLLGKGNSFKVKDVPQGFEADAEGEMEKIYASFGVTGERAAVVHALNIGLLKTEKLVEQDYDWSLFNDLKPVQVSILEALTHAKHETLDEDELTRLSISSSEDPKYYVRRSVGLTRDKLGLENETQTVVYYYAFRERQKEQGDLAVPARETIPTEANILTERQIRVLELLAQGSDPSTIANRFGVKRSTVIKHRNQALGKLNAHTVGEALGKVRQPSNL